MGHPSTYPTFCNRSGRSVTVFPYVFGLHTPSGPFRRGHKVRSLTYLTKLLDLRSLHEVGCLIPLLTGLDNVASFFTARDHRRQSSPVPFPPSPPVLSVLVPVEGTMRSLVSGGPGILDSLPPWVTLVEVSPESLTSEIFYKMEKKEN